MLKILLRKITALDLLCIGHGAPLLVFLDTRDATELRRVCHGLRIAVARFPWHDTAPRVFHVSLWRACFPRATACNISQVRSVTDVDFEHLAGIQTLNMSYCHQATITDAAFSHLDGIKTLNMSHCDQTTITDAAFSHLVGIQTLDMSGCSQDTITDGAFSHLAGIQTLVMSHCVQTTITDAAFSHLAGIQSLDMSHCDQTTITDAAFSHLAGIQTLMRPGDVHRRHV